MFHVHTTAILPLLLVLFPNSAISIFPWDLTAGSLLKLINGDSLPAVPNKTKSEMFMTTRELIESHGYPFENHQVTTEDGYVLELHRIPQRKIFNVSQKKIPIIMVPGLLADSGCFVTAGEFNSPGYVFSDYGYDVWLHNNRGTRYSRKHTHLNPDKDRQYWNYSFHEMGVYDLSTSVDYILSTTEATQIYMIGHSMGGAATSIFITERTSHNSKVKAVFLLSPAIGLEQTRVPLAHMPKLSEGLLLLFDEMEILPYNDNTLKLITSFCNSPKLSTICKIATEYILHIDFLVKNSTSISRILAGTCVKVLRHFLQMANKNYFSKYDYGLQGNTEMYGQETAPPYPLGSTSVPVFVFYAEDDSLVISSDIMKVSQNFANLNEIINVADKTFGHLDFVLSPKAKILVYDTIMNRMSKLTSSEQPASFVIDLSYLLIDATLILLIILMIVLLLIYHLKSKETPSSK